MALEIERRFLVAGQAWRAHVTWQARLQQGYLSAAADGFTTRVRSDGDGGAWLTLKCAATDQGPVVRHEFEYPIPAADAAALLSLAPVALSKWRHGLDLPGGQWVLDVFEGANAPLLIAEVELASATQGVSVPSWCVHEITAAAEFSNAALAHTPLAAWSPGLRQPVLDWLQTAPASASEVQI